ncbi:MAG: hypothetical protein ACE5JL_10555, partial [Dehalococcoidia bacterium]
MDWARILAYNWLQRLRSFWVLLTLAAFAVLVSVTLVTAAFIYTEVQAEAGLKHTLASTSETSMHTQIITQDRPLRPADYDKLRVSIEEEITEEVGWLRRSQQRLGRSQWLPFVSQPTDRLTFNSPVAFFNFRTGFDENTQVVAGRRPQVVPMNASGLELEVTVGANAARTMGWEVGSTIYVIPFFDSPSEQLIVHVVGLVEPTDPQDIYWLGDTSDFSTALVNDSVLVQLHLSEEAFFQQLGSTYPFFTGSYWWLVFLDTELLTPGSVQSTLSQLERLEADINKQFRRSLVITGLDALLV